MTQSNAIQVRDLTKPYRGTAVNAADGVSFEVTTGQLFCLLGPNGAGKTTTVSILTTTLAPTAGSVTVAGHDLRSEQAAIRAALGAVFQEPSLDLNLTGEENVRLHAVLYGLHPWRPVYRLMPAAYRRQVEELAGVLGVADVLGRPVRSLSGGTRRKLEIVRALMHRPAVLLLDEPTAGLDPEARRSLWQHLDEARRQLGTTILLTTHYLHEAEPADRVCVLWKGRVLADCAPHELKRGGTAVLRVDSHDRPALLAELASLGLQVAGEGPFQLQVGQRRTQEVLQQIRTQLSLLTVSEPTLEEAYLDLLVRARSGDAGQLPPAQRRRRGDGDHVGPEGEGALGAIEASRQALKRAGMTAGHELWSLLAIAARDVTKLLRDRTRLMLSLAFPVLIFAGLGSLLQPTVGRTTGLSAITLIFTGVLPATLFQSAAGGMTWLIEDRETDFAREMFVAPVSRVTIVAGKVVGEALVALVQGAGIVLFGLAFGVRLDLPHLFLLIPVGVAAALAGAAFGLAALSALPNQRSAIQVIPFMVMPQYFLAGVISPLRGVPAYLAVIGWAMPMRYPVDLARAAFYLGTPGYATAVTENPMLDIFVTAVVFLVLVVFGAVLFDHREHHR